MAGTGAEACTLGRRQHANKDTRKKESKEVSILVGRGGLKSPQEGGFSVQARQYMASVVSGVHCSGSMV